MNSSIKVVQYMWGDENRSYSHVRRINERYCGKHGYEYSCTVRPPSDERSCHWEKVLVIREELVDCDFLLFLDADAWFYGQEFRIETILLPLLGDRSLLMASDCGCENLKWKPLLPNTGVILARNNGETKKMLDEWYDAGNREEFARLRTNRLHEQEVFWKTLWRTDRDKISLLNDYYLMNGFYGLFIRHQMVTPERERREILERYIENNLDVSWNWAIAMLTADRPENSLARTLDGFRDTGFDPPVVFYDGEKRCGIWNWYRALSWLLENNPKAHAYAIVEDDVLFSKNIRSYLEGELWPSIRKDGCICSVFTPTWYLGESKWNKIVQGNRTYMSQFRIYHPATAKKLVRDIPKLADFDSHRRQNDRIVGEWISRNEVDIWYHTPSLVQHAAVRSTSYPTRQIPNYRLGLSRQFVGCDFIATKKNIETYSMNLPPSRVLPELTLSMRNWSTESAVKLAGILDRCNCDIERLVCLDDGRIPLRELERSIDILRLTGKVLRVIWRTFHSENGVSLEKTIDQIETMPGGKSQSHGPVLSGDRIFPQPVESSNEEKEGILLEIFLANPDVYMREIQ